MEWLILLALVLVPSAVSAGVLYLILRPRLRATQEYDEKTYYENEKLYERNRILTDNNQTLLAQNDKLKQERNTLAIQRESVIEQIDNLNHNMSMLQTQAQEAADIFYASRMEAAQEKLAQSLLEENQKYQENIVQFQEQYDTVVADLLEAYKKLAGNVAAMRATNDAAVAAAKRAEEIRKQTDFYRIQLSETDIHEIELLRSVEPYLRDKEPLNKIIWKCYYEKPTTDLIGRVIGSGTHTGIYKITEIETSKCYVGQAANLADRWKQHIRRGVGAETPTRNKLYPAMIAAGPENFTFEVVEECDRALLDEREDYWQDYFKAKEFGYSIK